MSIAARRAASFALTHRVAVCRVSAKEPDSPGVEHDATVTPSIERCICRRGVDDALLLIDDSCCPSVVAIGAPAVWAMDRARQPRLRWVFKPIKLAH